MATAKANVANKSQSMTKKEVKAYLAELTEKLSEEELPHLHTLVALDRVFRLPNAREIFDEELTGQAKQLWNQLKSSGIDLADPPLLFGTETLKEESNNSSRAK